MVQIICETFDCNFSCSPQLRKRKHLDAILLYMLLAGAEREVNPENNLKIITLFKVINCLNRSKLVACMLLLLFKSAYYF